MIWGPMSEQLDLINPKVSVRKPQEPIARAATIEGNYRYDLTRSWGSGPPICWVLLNPSVGDHLRDDPTIWNIMCRSLRWGFGSLVVVNIYPFRSPSPAALKLWRRDASVNLLYDNNVRATRHMMRAEMVIAAWGAHAADGDIDYLVRFPDGNCPIADNPVKLYCLGLTRSGAPLHPLARGKNWVPMDRKPIPFTFEPPEDYH
jgi:hypothetical protein